MMMRFRRYRVFLIFAGILTFCLYRFSSLRNWDATNTIKITGLKGYSGQASNGGDLRKDDATVPAAPAAPAPIEPVEEPAVIKALELSTTSTSSYVAVETLATGKSATGEDTTSVQDTVNTIPGAGIPDRRPITLDDTYSNDLSGTVEEVQEGRKDITAIPTASPIHWKKQKEYFPVPTESIIQLPTGKPVSIRKIQHAFNDETRDAKIDREKKQDAVKAEFKRAWAGYKKYAWLQDELSPVTGKFRNPFCGWAATLVDTLDTLWIMGLEEEFEEAANAVDLIDFTTSHRSDIPMFETTIRYLGGLLAAYDVSNGKYGNLLDKAVELAEILMGAFDTPNRMPILFYRWKPAFASQPHRASNKCNLAEFGSLSMEFTRLAQLTKEPKYYDAVARITEALADYQTRGTKLDGVFPHYVDASGCNNTKEASSADANRGNLNGPGLAITPAYTKEPEGFKPQMPAPVRERKPQKAASKDEPFELQVISDNGGPSKAHIQEISYETGSQTADASKSSTKIKNSKRAAIDPVADESYIKSIAKQAVEDTAVRQMIPSAKLNDDGTTKPNWECRPQGLESSSKGKDSFSMGGGQDSTYEYFSKQYVLLGGHEDTYRSMYLKTMEAVRKHMLFRPMLPDERDILFSGAVTTGGHPEITGDTKFGPEITHLTCFIGGMVGMGAKLFDIPGDIEIAKKLTDGCVWAYEVTQTGIMPEIAKAIPCADATSCPWNETLYWEYLDPVGLQRDINAQEFKQNVAILDSQTESERLAGAASHQGTEAPLNAEGVALAQTAAEAQKEEGSYYSVDPEVRAGQAGYLADEAAKEDSYHAHDAANLAKDAAAPTVVDPLNKRQLATEETTLTPVHDFRDDVKDSNVEAAGQSNKEVPKAPTHDFRDDVKDTKTEAAGQSNKEVPQAPTHDFRDDISAAMAEKKLHESESEGTYKPIGDDFRVYVDQPDDTFTSTTTTTTSDSSVSNIDNDYQRKLLTVEAELNAKVPVETKPNLPPPGMPTLPGTPTTERPLDPNGVNRNTLPSSHEQADKYVQAPLTHEEYVKNRIAKERLPVGMVSVDSKKYILRPEAIESVWYMYRITGDPIWQEKGWRMYEAIISATHSEYGNSAIADVTNRMVTQVDEMESFWLAETLKYFYLLFSTPDVVSLDEWVLNTEAHPFKRPVA